MSEENLDLVRRAVSAYSRGDLDGLFEDWAPDAVLDWSNSRGLDARVFHGLDEIRSFTERFIGSFDAIRIDLEDVFEITEGVVIAENVVHVRGRDGIEAQARSTWLITIRDGRQTSLTLFQTREEALGAADRSDAT
ncbi:MAG TPA: nuclear transport factor 2 family protein [Solirubrobacterales bacterium]|nr:nuclear transport factor 2 family protein [Solirubrobacterales bacterium]